MNKFWKSNFAFLCYTLLAAVVIGFIIIIATKVWLSHYTHHGDEVVVPNICGMYVEEAAIYLEQQGLSVDVIDSTYSKKVPLGTIVEQRPHQGATTKNGRQIYVVINSRMQRTIPLPDLHDLSYRQAVATVQSLGMEVSDVIYKPSEFGGLVLDVIYKGESLEADTPLPEGSRVILVVGKGANNAETVYVPQLEGKTLDQARRVLLQNSLVVGGINYDDEVSDEFADNDNIIYYQEPEAGKWVSEGSRITLYLSKDPNKKMQNTTNSEEEFF